MLENRQRRLQIGSSAAPMLIAMVGVTGRESTSANLIGTVLYCTMRGFLFSTVPYLKGARIDAVDRATGRTAVKGHASVKEGVLKRQSLAQQSYHSY